MSVHALVQIKETCRAFADQDRYRIGGDEVNGLPKCGLGVDALAVYLGRRSTSAASRDAIWRGVIDHAHGPDQNWSLIAIRLAMPGIRRAVSRAQHILPDFDRGELETEAVYAFTEALNTIQTNRSKLCSRLCQRVSSHLRTFLRAQLREINTTTHMEFESRIPRQPYGHVDLVLAQAVHEQVVTQYEALLIGAVRIDGVDIKRIADKQGITRIELKLAFKMAEDRLVQWILKK